MTSKGLTNINSERKRLFQRHESQSNDLVIQSADLATQPKHRVIGSGDDDSDENCIFALLCANSSQCEQLASKDSFDLITVSTCS